MKELKFKAWDGKQIRQDITGFECEPNGTIVGVFLDGDYYGIERDDIKLMQYIGKNDKNKKEIYQQDFVKVGNKVYLVSWHYRYCSFTVKSKGDLHNHFFGEAFEAEDCEVIGNIYENPELLKDNK